MNVKKLFHGISSAITTCYNNKGADLKLTNIVVCNSTAAKAEVTIGFYSTVPDSVANAKTGSIYYAYSIESHETLTLKDMVLPKNHFLVIFSADFSLSVDAEFEKI
jgi:hypothetical protein